MIVYYYSATGNSLYVAKEIAEGINDSTLMSIPRQLDQPSPTTEKDIVGFVFPMHYFGVPPLVREFIEKLELKPSTYVFAVVTCGHHAFGSALCQISRLLQDKGETLDAGFYIDMISNYIPLSELPPPARRQERLVKADEKVRQIVRMIKERQHIVEPEYFRWPCQAINSYWRSSLLPRSQAKFTNSAACTGCGMCAEVCPVENIRLESGKPIWQNHCQECLGCLHICPVQSIDFGKTQGRTRYRHPKVAAAELIQTKAER